MNNDFTNRLSELMDYYGYNKNSFSIAVGASNNTVIGRILNEKDRRPSFALIESILKKFPLVNPAWLLLGEGDMLKDDLINLPDIKDRIMKVCEITKFPIVKLADVAGIPSKELIDVVQSDAKPTKELLKKILSAFPIINSDWLLNNNGSILIKGVNFKSLVPYYDEVPSGSTRESLSSLTPAFSVFNSRAKSNENLFGYRTQSNDFAPFITAGDYLCVDIVEVEDLVPSDLVLIVTEKRNYIRRISRSIDPGSETITVADNTGASYEINKKDITMIGLIKNMTRIID